MKTLLRDIRIIPILLIATCCLVVLKVSGLLLEGGYILNDTPKPKSWAQETFNFPSPGKLDSSDVTGSVAAKMTSRSWQLPRSRQFLTARWSIRIPTAR